MFLHLVNQEPANSFVWNPDKAFTASILSHREQAHLGEDAEQIIDLGGIDGLLHITDISWGRITHPSEVLHVGEDGTRHLMEYYLFIEKRYSETSSAYREEISKTLLYALMLEICNIFRNVSDEDSDIAKPRQEKLTDDFFKLMAKHYRTEHNVAFYAAKLHRTPKYLSGAIRRISGRSVAEWINSTLVSEIKMLLTTTDKTVL